MAKELAMSDVSIVYCGPAVKSSAQDAAAVLREHLAVEAKPVPGIGGCSR